MVLGSLAFLVVLAATTPHSAAGLKAGFTSLGHWHKLLLIPISAALCRETAAKLFFIRNFLAATAFLCVASYCFYFFNWGAAFASLLQERGPGIILRNHATQGMAFGVAAFSFSVLLFFRSGDGRWTKTLLGGSAILLVGNIAFITSGRSGYLVLLVCALTLAVGVGYIKKMKPLATVGMGFMLLIAVSAVLWAAPKSRERVQQGVQEIKSYQLQDEGTSMGLRMYFWTTTPALIAKKPLFGWGTGGFEEAYRQEVEGRTGSAGLVTRDPHNQYLKIMAEQGLFGFAVFLTFLVSVALQRPAPIFRVLGLGVFLGWCATSLANAHFSTFSEGTFLYIWLGAMLASPVNRSG